jgi:nitrate/nitrite-specific signal transduction histidine kinase
MELKITRRLYKSKIKSEWDINYYFITIRDQGKRVYQKHVNPYVYDLDVFIEELRKTFIGI